MSAARSEPSDSFAAAAVGPIPTGGEEFGQIVEVHRRDLVLLAYRFLGSLGEAEEAAQEALLRAWRARGAFRGESSVRTWLHRIATRVCLDAIAGRGRRVLPVALGPASDPADAPDRNPSEIAWLEPLPDDYIADASADPAARYSVRESVSLAFLAALQTLPARQRAVLLLRDVLGWSAAEVATTLEMSVSAANSALHRARALLQATHHRSGLAAMPAGWPSDPEIRRLLDAYIRAWETDDVAALVATLRDDVRLAMPPSPSWYQGRAPVVEFLGRWVFPDGRYRLPLTSANGQPAVLFVAVDQAGSERAIGIQVLTADRAGVADITSFMDPAIAARFAPGRERP